MEAPPLRPLVQKRDTEGQRRLERSSRVGEGLPLTAAVAPKGGNHGGALKGCHAQPKRSRPPSGVRAWALARGLQSKLVVHHPGKRLGGGPC